MGIEWLGTWNRRALSKPSLYYTISHQKTMIYGDGIFHCIESPSAAVYEFHIFYPRSATVYFIISNTRIPIGIEQQQKKKKQWNNWLLIRRYSFIFSSFLFCFDRFFFFPACFFVYDCLFCTHTHTNFSSTYHSSYLRIIYMCSLCSPLTVYRFVPTHTAKIKIKIK